MKMSHSFTTLKLLTLAAALSTAALVDAQDYGTKTAKVAGAVQTDGQILQVMRSISNAEIKQADLALKKSTNAQVKATAQSIKNDHNVANEKINQLLEGALDLDDSDLNGVLQDQTEDTHDMLAKLEGAQLDCQYLQKQVEEHEVALDTVKNDLIPDAKDAGVKAFLTASTTTLEHHMHLAQDAIKGLTGCVQRTSSID